MTKSQKKARARENWDKLRNHVKKWRAKINFLAFSNDEAEITKKIMGYDADKQIDEFDMEQDGEPKEEENKSCIQTIIILPLESTTK